MPIYEFYCQTCKKHFSRFVQVDERGIMTTGNIQCPHCLDYDVERVLTYPARIEVK